MKVGTITYSPPRGKLNSEAFMENLAKFKATYPLYVLSDDQSWNPSQVIPNPEIIGRRPAWGLNNLLFFEALLVAKKAGLEYFLYIESDSRVGCDGFDDRIFSEFFNRYRNGIACAGSPVAWDICSGGRDFAARVIDQVFRYQSAGALPACIYSSKHPFDQSGGCYYPNGSLAVYKTEAMCTVFGGFDNDLPSFSKQITAYDLALGKFLWNYHGPRAVEHVGWLTSCYSGYGNAITTEKERLQMLVDGSKVAIHQVKGI